MIEVGELIGGKYRVLRTIGEGGMGVVLAAEHVHVGEAVAVKILKPDVLVRPEMLARFVREARTAMKLKSEHVVRVFDVDMIGGSLPYLVMELLEGRDLATVIAEDGPLPVRTAVDWVLQACESIAEAHALGVVHRDLKPANLFLTKRPDGSSSIKVLDFGVSKVAWADDVGAVTEPTSDSKIAVEAAASKPAGLTNTNATLGSPRYMSPEQLRSARSVDTRADVWALGATLFELLCGRAPFVGATTEEITARIQGEKAPAIKTLRPSVPSTLDAALARCLRKDPDERFADMAQLAAALAPFGSEEAARSAARTRATLGLAAAPRGFAAGRVVASGLVLAAAAAFAIVRWRAGPADTPHPAPSVTAAVTAATETAQAATRAPIPAASEQGARAGPAETRPAATTPAAPSRAARPVGSDAGVGRAATPDGGKLDPAHAFDQPD